MSDPKHSKEVEQEAKSLIKLNKELESILGTTEEKQAEVEQETIGKEMKARRLISIRGYEIFDYDEVREEWEQGVPVLRDFQLPLCKPLIKSHFKFWMIASPFAGTCLHTMLHIYKHHSTKKVFNKRLPLTCLGLFTFGFST